MPTGSPVSYIMIYLHRIFSITHSCYPRVVSSEGFLDFTWIYLWLDLILLEIIISED